jgi:hypothetical protein
VPVRVLVLRGGRCDASGLGVACTGRRLAELSVARGTVLQPPLGHVKE